MRIEWNKVTWYSKLTAVVLGIAIFALGFYIGALYQQGRSAIELVEELRIERKSIVDKEVKEVAPAYDFIQEGNIRNIAEGDVEEDNWLLIYEQPGAPALTRSLIFTTQSRCVFEKGIMAYCNTTTFEQGERVVIMGAIEEDGSVVVEVLESVR